MHASKRGKKKGEREKRGLCLKQAVYEGNVHGQGGAHSIALAKGAIRTAPPGQKPFHHHPGMAGKAGHVLHTPSMELCGGRDSRSLVRRGHCGQSYTGHAITSQPINGPMQPRHPGLQPHHRPLPLPRRCQPFPAPQKPQPNAGGSFPGVPSLNAGHEQPQGTGHPLCVPSPSPNGSESPNTICV